MIFWIVLCFVLTVPMKGQKQIFSWTQTLYDYVEIPCCDSFDRFKQKQKYSREKAPDFVQKDNDNRFDDLVDTTRSFISA